MRHLNWQTALISGVVSGVVIGGATCSVAEARPIADDTLGTERSSVVPLDPTVPVDLIQGGARRGNNLFHSFREFHVDTGRGVYFANPGVENVIGRVTGGVESQILGVLGVLGNANLFLINPKGIVFGPNAQLDVRGSFTATTANAIQFGNQGFFSATNPTAPALLTVQPSAFLFNQLNPAPIVNRSIVPVQGNLPQVPEAGLRAGSIQCDGRKCRLGGTPPPLSESMRLTLIEALQQVEDFRAKRGQRYPLWVILLLVVLGTLNGATSYQALEEFAQRHYPALVHHLHLPYKRLPSDSTLRRALMGVDFRQLAQAFMNWAKPYLDRDEARWFAIDGKGLNGSLTDPCEAHQQFVNLVSVFSHAQGIVVAMEQYRSNQGSEIAVVEALIAALDLPAVTYTMDAAHAQKKR